MGTGDIFIFLDDVEGVPLDDEDDDDPFLLDLSDLGETPLPAAPPPPDLTDVTDPDLSRGERLEFRLDDRELAGLDRDFPVQHQNKMSNWVLYFYRDFQKVGACCVAWL